MPQFISCSKILHADFLWRHIIQWWQKFYSIVTWDAGLNKISVLSYSRIKLLPPLCITRIIHFYRKRSILQNIIRMHNTTNSAIHPYEKFCVTNFYCILQHVYALQYLTSLIHRNFKLQQNYHGMADEEQRPIRDGFADHLGVRHDVLRVVVQTMHLARLTPALSMTRWKHTKRKNKKPMHV